MLKTSTIRFYALLILAILPMAAGAQNGLSDLFNTFKLEARGDAQGSFVHQNVDGSQVGDTRHPFGIQGRYFNLIMGGNFGNGFSYHFRQRFNADNGSISFFDNTDFLWLNYQISDNWRVRIGKDAMAVGGFEYDAPPIDEYMVSEYWNNIYCFQIGMSAAYSTDDHRHTFVAQVTQSPYIRSRNLGWDAGLLAYNIEWMGSIGDNITTLWSTGLLERERNHFMNLTILGTRFTSTNGKFDAYLDLMHHALANDDWGKNLGLVFRFNFHLTPKFCLFTKESFEQNKSEIDLNSPTAIDNLVPAGHRYAKFGIGCEYYPIPAVRLHAYVAKLSDETIDIATTDHSLTFNLGATWTMDFKKLKIEN